MEIRKIRSKGVVDVIVKVVGESHDGKKKDCESGSNKFLVAFTDIHEDSEVWEVGSEGVMRLTRNGFDAAIGQLLGRLKPIHQA